MKQKISELLDEELPDGERSQVLHDMAGDRELRGTWERYHLIRAALRKELGVIVHPGVADQIGAVLAAENIVPMRRRSYQDAIPRVAKLAAGLAIAASVATVAVISLQPKAQMQTAARAEIQAGRAADHRIAAASLAAGVAPAARAQTEPAAYQDALNAFLVEHGEVTPPAGMGGMMSFVRLVGYRNEYSHR